MILMNRIVITIVVMIVVVVRVVGLWLCGPSHVLSVQSLTAAYHFRHLQAVVLGDFASHHWDHTNPPYPYHPLCNKLELDVRNATTTTEPIRCNSN